MAGSLSTRTPIGAHARPPQRSAVVLLAEADIHAAVPDARGLALRVRHLLADLGMPCRHAETRSGAFAAVCSLFREGARTMEHPRARELWIRDGLEVGGCLWRRPSLTVRHDTDTGGPIPFQGSARCGCRVLGKSILASTGTHVMPHLCHGCCLEGTACRLRFVLLAIASCPSPRVVSLLSFSSRSPCRALSSPCSGPSPSATSLFFIVFSPALCVGRGSDISCTLHLCLSPHIRPSGCLFSPSI